LSVVISTNRNGQKESEFEHSRWPFTVDRERL
jgi:hypothetical protein